ncbi:hypothetical protein MUP32_02660 [Candidatus Microgenomates bacterium]|nr:hypothetical protein [Candidatus Microgenomates bacterium]
MKKFSHLFYFGILVLFFFIQFSFLAKRTQSFNFADENEHLTPAWEMVRRNKSLYQDLSTNHQPLPILSAYVFFKTVPVANAFMLIERVRQFVFFLSFLGAFFITLRFGLRGLIASILIELIKFYFFGYHLLAESLVIYPLMYMAGVMVEYSFFKIGPRKNSLLLKLDDGVFGFCLFWIAFNLSPLWPFLIFSLLYYLRVRMTKKEPPAILFISFGIFTALLFLMINPFSWFRETVVNNYRYYLPYQASFTIKEIFYYLVYPCLSIFNSHQPIAKYYLALLSCGLVYIVIFLRQTKSRNTCSWLFLYFLLILLNLRTTSMNIGFYTAFHVLPQAAFLTMLIVGIADLNIRKPLILFSFLALSIMIFNATLWWRESVSYDKFNEHFIQFGNEESIGMALPAVKNEKDTLLAGPQSGFINIFADIPLATRQTAYLAWGYRCPALKQEFETILGKSAPTFIYFPASDNPYYLALFPLLEKNYARIQRTFGGETDLYILNTEIGKRTPEQWKKFADLLYQPPKL